MVKLGECTTIRTGKLDANASSENGQYPFFTCSVTPLRIDNYSYDCECVLVAGNGDLNVKYYNGRFDAYQRTYIIESKDKTILIVPYLYCFLDKYVETLREQAIGGVIKYIKLGNLTDAIIPLPSVKKQDEIVERLDKVSGLIEKRKTQLEKLDLLIKSRFIEMFGDESKYHSKPLTESVEEMFIGPFGSSLKNECFVSKDAGYCMVYEQKHAIRKTMDVDTRYVDEKKYTELQRFTIKAGDIIVSCRGTIGETFVVPDGAPMGIMHPSIMKIRLKESIYNKVFFNYLLMNVLKQHEAEANGSGIKMAITATELGKEPFIVPSMDLQKRFASFVEQVDKSKFEIQKSLEKLETLKKSLMQQYFG